MLVGRRWVQVTDMDPLNPFQRRRILPAFGNDEGAHGMFMFNPVPVNFSVATGRYDLQGPITSGTMTTLAVAGGIAGAIAGVLWATGRF